jgi:ubiquitin carboxyl-terminal hydrolase 4/11/15
MEQLEETEMWYCNRCKEHVRAWKQFHLYRAPPILIIHLKRFQYSATTHRRDKINIFIDFPLEGLDLSEHVMHWTDAEKPVYDCYAVSNHFGGLGGGHYTAYALNDDGVWCHYDDSRVTTHVDPKEVVSSSAYVLYYRRKDVPVGEDFVLNMTTPGMDSPAIIHDSLDKSSGVNEDGSSSNAAMIDEDENMEIDAELPSRSTSPTGSIGSGGHLEGRAYGSDEKSAFADEDLPLQ